MDKQIVKYEHKYYENGAAYIAGVDEVGRGPLAGPVCAAAVVLPRSLLLSGELDGINDSKKLSEKKRKHFCDIIKEKALFYHVAYASHKVIDTVNILQATKNTMREAVYGLAHKPDVVLVDGNFYPFDDITGECIIKGDMHSVSIMAAAIIAKVERDAHMTAYDRLYPVYNFKSNKGYGTRAHIDAIKNHGICPIHRLSFVKKFV